MSTRKELIDEYDRLMDVWAENLVTDLKTARAAFIEAGSIRDELLVIEEEL